MLSPKPMKKLVVFGPKPYMKKVIESLYGLNVVHIEDYTKQKDTMFDIGNPLEENLELSETLVKIRSLKDNIDITGISNKRDHDIEEIKTNISKLHSQIHILSRKKYYYKNILDILKKNKLKDLSNSLKIYEKESFKSHHHFIGFVSDPSGLKQDFENISYNIDFRKAGFENLDVVAVFSKSRKEKINQILEEADFIEIPQPYISSSYPSLESKPDSKFSTMQKEIKDVEKRLGELKDEIENIKKQNSEFILSSEKTVQSEVDKAEAPLRFATTDNTFLITGWVPKKDAKKVKSALNKISKNIYVDLKDPERNDKVPISFDNPKLVRPFESFMELYTLPSYKEIDPTFFMFLTFPIFFGFMLGDFGYGLITLMLFLFLKKKMPSMKAMLNAFIIASISTMIFGMAYGEYFGMEYIPNNIAQDLGMQAYRDVHSGEILYPIPHLFSRSHGISDLLSASIIIGILHITIGLIVGFINIAKQHGIKHAITEKGGWILIMPFIVWLLQDYLGVITGPISEMIGFIMPPLPFLVGLFLLGAVLTVTGEGIIGLIEVMFFSIMSNVLSYARLMAVGLASLSLAVVVNDLAGEMITQGVGGVIAAVLILVLGHAINIALGILSPFLHSLRLHYVEFFGKFFKGGGKAFGSFGSSQN